MGDKLARCMGTQQVAEMCAPRNQAQNRMDPFFQIGGVKLLLE